MHDLFRILEKLVGWGTALAIIGWGLIIFSGFFLGICLILILDDIRILLLERWSPKWRGAHQTHGLERDNFFRGGVGWVVPGFLVFFWIRSWLVWLVWDLPAVVHCSRLGIACRAAQRPR